jgi:hypothetical protein
MIQSIRADVEAGKKDAAAAYREILDRGGEIAARETADVLARGEADYPDEGPPNPSAR